MKLFFRKSAGKQFEHDHFGCTQPNTVRVEQLEHYGVRASATALSYDRHTRLLAVAHSSGEMKLFGKSGVETTLEVDGGKAVDFAAFVPGKGALVCVTDKSTVTMLDLNTRSKLVACYLPQPITAAYLDNAGEFLFLGTRDGFVRVFDVCKMRFSVFKVNCALLLRESKKVAVTALASRPEIPNHILIGFSTGHVLLYDLQKQRCHAKFPAGHADPQAVTCVAWHSSGRHFAVGHANSAVCLWAVKDEARPCVTTFPCSFEDGSLGGVHSIQFSAFTNGNYAMLTVLLKFDPLKRAPSAKAEAAAGPEGGSKREAEGEGGGAPGEGGEDAQGEGKGGLARCGSSWVSLEDAMSQSSCLLVVVPVDMSSGVPVLGRAVPLPRTEKLFGEGQPEQQDLLVVKHATVANSFDWLSHHDNPYSLLVLTQKHAIVAYDLPVRRLVPTPFPAVQFPATKGGQLVVVMDPQQQESMRQCVAALERAERAQEHGDGHKVWPLSGGSAPASSASPPSMLVTHHCRGVVKFWDTTTRRLRLLHSVQLGAVAMTASEEGSGESVGALFTPTNLDVAHVRFFAPLNVLAAAFTSGEVVVFAISEEEHSVRVLPDVQPPNPPQPTPSGGSQGDGEAKTNKAERSRVGGAEVEENLIGEEPDEGDDSDEGEEGNWDGEGEGDEVGGGGEEGGDEEGGDKNPEANLAAEGASAVPANQPGTVFKLPAGIGGKVVVRHNGCGVSLLECVRVDDDLKIFPYLDCVIVGDVAGSVTLSKLQDNLELFKGGFPCDNAAPEHATCATTAAVYELEKREDEQRAFKFDDKEELCVGTSVFIGGSGGSILRVDNDMGSVCLPSKSTSPIVFLKAITATGMVAKAHRFTDEDFYGDEPSDHDSNPPNAGEDAGGVREAEGGDLSERSSRSSASRRSPRSQRRSSERSARDNEDLLRLKMQRRRSWMAAFLVAVSSNAVRLYTSPQHALVSSLSLPSPAVHCQVVEIAPDEGVLVVLHVDSSVSVYALPDLRLVAKEQLADDLALPAHLLRASWICDKSGDVFVVGHCGDITRFSVLDQQYFTFPVHRFADDGTHAQLVVNPPALPERPRSVLKDFWRGAVDLGELITKADEQAYAERRQREQEEDAQAVRMERQRGQASQVQNAIAQAKQRAIERGEKLSQVQDKSEDMANNAQQFLAMVEEYNKQQANKKWWQL